ncbi:hypothetical protein FOS06_03850 [Niallia circulans]|nr:hypothetical protein [Niallia circulans]
MKISSLMIDSIFASYSFFFTGTSSMKYVVVWPVNSAIA